MPESTYSQEEVDRLIAEAKESAATDAEAKAQARAQYGDPVGAGGGTPTRPQPRGGSFEAAQALVLDRLQKGDGLQDSAGKLAQSQWQAGRIREAFEAAIYRPSYRSFSRTDPNDKKIQDDRRSNRGRGSV